VLSFHLQGKVSNTYRDYINFDTVYGIRKTMCGKRTKTLTIRSPTYAAMRFYTDSSITKPGFNISTQFVPTNCHQYIRTTAVGETGTIATPAYNKRHKEATVCNYAILAPSGAQVKLDSLTVKTRKSTGCKTNHVLVNGAGQYWYPTSTSKIFCGYSTQTNVVTSTTGRLYVGYSGARRKSKGMKFKYTIV